MRLADVRKTLSLTVSIVFFIGMSASVLAQETSVQSRGVEAKSFRAVRVESAPVLDGVLDDEVWQQAETITDFHHSRPGDHTEPPENTDLYVI